MSQAVVDRSTGSTANDAAAQAVITHHAHLSAQLNERIEALLRLVDSEDLVKAESVRQDLLGYVHRELLPHALAEEQALYPPAAALPGGKLLVAGMVQEHRALTTLVAELADASSMVRAGAAGQALGGLFATHLAKENDLVLPLLVADPTVSLADVLAGMHELLGSDETVAHGSADAATATPAGCGGEHCGCGGDSGPTSAAAPVLSVDARLDVREVPHSQRHQLLLSTLAALPLGEAVVLVASHAPRPLLAEVDDRLGAQVSVQWLQSGPEVWQVRLERVATPT